MNDLQMNFNLASYDRLFLAFSGGKDSTACYLRLLEMGVKPEQIELHHHLVDGREGSKLMDWAVTEDYCRAFARHFGSPIYFSWKQQGFEGEMNRQNERTKPIVWETPGGATEQKGGTGGKLSTRRMFPQVTANLSQRWCSAYLKIDVGACVIRNSERFKNARTLVITGERAEESAARAKYEVLELDRADGRNTRFKRHVDHWRPIHSWSEQKVWDIIKRHSVLVHPAYRLGWGRLSCMACIFGNKDQWASIRAIAAGKFHQIALYEYKFEKTIHRTKSIVELADLGEPYAGLDTSKDVGLSALVDLALSETYWPPITVSDWHLPAGAFADSNGPS